MELIVDLEYTTGYVDGLRNGTGRILKLQLTGREVDDLDSFAVDKRQSQTLKVDAESIGELTILLDGFKRLLAAGQIVRLSY